ncbi:MAG: hypothetical protein ABSD42_03965 [Candidatus Bathyarchaeia archaeon]|jgi:hypothetical protein
MSEPYDQEVIKKIKLLPGTPFLRNSDIWILYFIYHVMNERGTTWTELEQSKLMSTSSLHRHVEYLGIMNEYLVARRVTPYGPFGYFLSAKAKKLMEKLYPKTDVEKSNAKSSDSGCKGTDEFDTINNIEKQCAHISETLKKLSNSFDSLMAEIQKCKQDVAKKGEKNAQDSKSQG